MNTINYKDLKQWHIGNKDAIATAERVFGNTQPTILQTGFYSAPSLNWSYFIGLVSVGGITYEVVTRFGKVISAQIVVIPELRV